MTFTLTAAQKNLLATLKPEDTTSWTTTKARQAYAWLSEWTSTNANRTDPKPGVDRSVWLWLQGARAVNLGTGYSSTFIRNYTSYQYLLRTGQNLNTTLLQKASDSIARLVTDRIVRSNGSLPTLPNIASDDSRGVSTTLNIPLAAWSGNLLFLALGDATGFRANLLGNQTRGDTYDLLAALKSFGAVSPRPLTGLADLGQALLETAKAFFGNSIGTLNTLSLINTAIQSGADYLRNSYGVVPDVLFGNTVLGTAGNDAALTGTANYDLVHGGAGNDRLVASGGQDILDGGAGIDTVDFRTLNRAQRLVLERSTLMPAAVGLSEVQQTSATQDMTISFLYNIEKVILSGQNDKAVFATVIPGFDVDGAGGNDVVATGVASKNVRIDLRDSANQTITDIASGAVAKLRNFEFASGGSGNDEILGRSAAANILSGDFGNDRLTGGTANDTLYGDAGSDTLAGGGGNDTLFGGAGNDLLAGDAGNDSYVYSRSDNSRDTIDETGGTDTLLMDGVGHREMWFRRQGNDLALTVMGSTDGVTVRNWYSTPNARVESIASGNLRAISAADVNVLVQAMAAFATPPASLVLLPEPQRQQLETLVASAWKQVA
jgi:Ca2+-binding RTX toxin-like protein